MNNKNNILPHIINCIVGAVCGIIVITKMNFLDILEKRPSYFFFILIFALFLILVASFVHSIIHEFGHLIFGLMTGYSFISFRIGRLILVNERESLKLKIYNVVGTSGQCLMMPPIWKNGIPYFLYNLGGCLMNILFSILFYLGYMSTENNIVAVVFLIFSVVGLSVALMNGIPMQANGLSNDGRNALLLGKSEESLRAFWLQLYVSGLITKGERIRNLPEEWFFLPTGESLNDSIICAVGILRYNYFFDCHNFEKAEETINYMLHAPGLLPIHKNELLCELLFLRVYRGAENHEIDSLLTPALNKYIKATATYASRKRLAFAYFYLYKKQYDYALKCLAEFEKVCNTYPYSSEIENEKEIVELVKKRSEEIDPDC